jgi:hypothetical protein
VTRAILVAAALSACTPATMKRGLHYVATATEIGAQGSLACDAGSTHSAIAHGNTETNVIMGEHPSDGTLGVYFATSAALVAGYNRVLPDILRIAANVTIAGAEFAAVANNVQWQGGACGL